MFHVASSLRFLTHTELFPVTLHPSLPRKFMQLSCLFISFIHSSFTNGHWRYSILKTSACFFKVCMRIKTSFLIYYLRHPFGGDH